MSAVYIQAYPQVDICSTVLHSEAVLFSYLRSWMDEMNWRYCDGIVHPTNKLESGVRTTAKIVCIRAWLLATTTIGTVSCCFVNATKEHPEKNQSKFVWLVNCSTRISIAKPNLNNWCLRTYPKLELNIEVTWAPHAAIAAGTFLIIPARTIKWELKKKKREPKECEESNGKEARTHRLWIRR